VVRAAYVEGEDLAALTDAGHAFLAGTIGFRELCGQLSTTPSRLDWCFVEPPLQVGSTNEGILKVTEGWRRVVRNTWLCAEWAAQKADPSRLRGSAESVLATQAHWPLITLSESTRELRTMRTLEAWMRHPTMVQQTRAEQLVIRHPDYSQTWHPYRETTGAMRRARLWSLLYGRHWGQVQAAAVADTLFYRSASAAQAAAIITTAVRDPMDGPIYQVVQGEWRRHLERATGPTRVGDALEQLEAGLAQDPDRYWQSFCSRYHGYAYDHVVPNLCIVVGALWASPENIPAAIEFTIARGFDVVANALITAAILAGALGPQLEPPPLPVVPAAIETGIQRTIVLTGPS